MSEDDKKDDSPSASDSERERPTIGTMRANSDESDVDEED
jgi:hypothetical protein